MSAVRGPGAGARPRPTRAAAARAHVEALAAANAALTTRSRLLAVIAEESRALLEAEDLIAAIGARWGAGGRRRG